MGKVKFVTEFADKTIGQWAAQWWNWYLSHDPDNNPTVGNMLFLKGGSSHNQRFKDNHQAANITPQTAIFFPVIDSIFVLPHKDHKDDTGKEFKTKALDDKELQTEDDIRRAILRERTSCKVASISNTADDDRDDIIPDGHYWQRAESSKFTLKVSKKSKFKNDFKPPLPSSSGIRSDDDYDYFDAICGGFYILTDPLPPSDKSYHLHFEARGESGYTNSGSYDIKVQ
jgi:hypothetical protein